MIKKDKEKLKAIGLRRKGFSYSEILKEVDVAKSTLALWLQSVGLSKKQKQRLTEKKLASARRGGLKKKENRILRAKVIREAAQKEIGELSKREKWLIGIALYWAEGTKEKEWRPGSGIKFSNSDPSMIKLFLEWLTDTCKIPKSMIIFEIYIHENNKHRLGKVISYWSKFTEFPRDLFNEHIYFKRNIIKTKRRNIGETYFGILTVRVRSSSSLIRKVSGWVDGINNAY